MPIYSAAWESSIAIFPIKHFSDSIVSHFLLAKHVLMFVSVESTLLARLRIYFARFISFVRSSRSHALVFFSSAAQFACQKTTSSANCAIYNNASKAWWRSQQIPNNFCRIWIVLPIPRKRDFAALRCTRLCHSCIILFSKPQIFRETSPNSFLSKMLYALHAPHIPQNRWIVIDLYGFLLDGMK